MTVRETLERMVMSNYRNKLTVGTTLVAPTMTGTITAIEYVETHHTYRVTVETPNGSQSIGYTQLDKLIDNGQIKIG